MRMSLFSRTPDPLSKDGLLSKVFQDEGVLIGTMALESSFSDISRRLTSWREKKIRRMGGWEGDLPDPASRLTKTSKR